MTAGKWRRYFSWWNFFDVFKIIAAFFKSVIFIWQEKPDLLISGGGFVSVPLHWAGWILGVPGWIHQQDVEPGLANRLMASVAKKITTALREGADQFHSKKTEWLGNPSRDLSGADLMAARTRFSIPQNSPVIFALGGGTGSARLNEMILEALPAWPRDWHVIHLVGKERPSELQQRAVGVFSNYHVYKFFTTEMKDAYALADVVIARAGFATITELAALSKAAVLLPMAGTHQEKNVKMFADNKAVVALNEVNDNGLKLAQIVKDLINNQELRLRLGKRLNEVLPRATPKRIVEIVGELVGGK
jgi:UDP-N-acetylglucosamine--N-acetylmuramyl-(pentapeptide) pyrophosphoryl-undecaprenol N-acetylglucosamine transferase